MIKYLIHRPIAVFMSFLAFFILGIITYLNIPVSLLPDIAIPEITIQVSGANTSARELENTVVSPIRQQLLQVGKLRDMQSETRDGVGTIKLLFEYGVDTDLAFIEVNEKVDAAMSYIPREIDRPRVVKASATDIPVQYLNLTLKEDVPYEQGNDAAFLNLSEFSESVIKRRIEQLPEVAMVDMTGQASKQVVVIPNTSMMDITDISLSDIESVLQNNNIEPGTMTVEDGHYEYNITFASVMRSVEDVQNIYLRKNDRIYQLKDIADIRETTQKEEGIALFNGKRAITMGIIKQADENMAKMQEVLTGTIGHMEWQYPDIEFTTNRNQTALLDFTISNLQQNLILAFLFVCFVSALFMSDVKSPLIIGLCMFVSLVICLLFFYLFNISLNIVSLTGLILALGMMIDNSIIVTDNISQYRDRGYDIEGACVMGTNEVIAPMLSSVLTTIAVFIPLIFISGIAGALFFDQAFSVTLGLLVSYVTYIMLLPVLYKLIYKIKTPRFLSRKEKTKKRKPVHERIYHKGVNIIFAHKAIAVIIVLLVLPMCSWLFTVIDKEKMPEVTQNELMVNIEWNENIHLQENTLRIESLLKNIKDEAVENSASIGTQQYLLNSDQAQTITEAELYIKVDNPEKIEALKQNIDKQISDSYPEAIVAFAPVGTVFEKIFATGDADLRAEYYSRKSNTGIKAESIARLESKLTALAGQAPVTTSFEEQMNISIRNERLLLYNVSYNSVFHALESSFKGNEVTTLRSYQQYLPITLESDMKDVNNVINNTLIEVPEIKNKIPLREFVSISMDEDKKSIIASRNGEFIPFDFYNIEEPQKLISTIRNNSKDNGDWDISFSGSFFTNNTMMDELILILLISILLMYFILAAQFESFVQPIIVLLEIPLGVSAALGLLIVCGQSLNLMSAIGIIVTCGVVINDSILKIDVMNQLRGEGMDLLEAIHEAGRRRLNAILMTSLTSIVCMLPLLFSGDLGSEIEKPLAIATIGGMLIGTPISLFIVPLAYWLVYRKKNIK